MIGTQKRADLWESDKKAKDGMPGPGAHSKSYSSFSNTKGNVNFGSGRKPLKNENPGPGQYDNGRTLTQTKTASVRFGST